MQHRKSAHHNALRVPSVTLAHINFRNHSTWSRILTSTALAAARKASRASAIAARSGRLRGLHLSSSRRSRQYLSHALREKNHRHRLECLSGCVSARLNSLFPDGRGVQCTHLGTRCTGAIIASASDMCNRNCCDAQSWRNTADRIVRACAVFIILVYPTQ